MSLRPIRSANVNLEYPVIEAVFISYGFQYSISPDLAANVFHCADNTS